ncbi:MAG: hypothetical protein GY849_08280 [Deltaproteobacteria bacterium]|nr:hypothetical protein [Deltaproteobacteria bacterium]
MAGLRMHGKRLGGLIAGLCAGLFFIGASGAGDRSFPSGQNYTSDKAPIRIAMNRDGIVVNPFTSRPDYKQHLTEVMDAVFNCLYAIANDRNLTTDEKQEKAKKYVHSFRYGPDKKDYFWINDLQGIMILEPYLPDMEGEEVIEYVDPSGLMIFKEFIGICRGQGEGFLSHLWPKYGQKKLHSPRLGLVRVFKPWGWVIGTGFYLELIETLNVPQESGTVGDREPATAPEFPVDDRGPGPISVP